MPEAGVAIRARRRARSAAPQRRLFGFREPVRSFRALEICPVSRFNGHSVGAGQVPGPVTKALTEAYIKLVDHDFVRQYLRHLNG